MTLLAGSDAVRRAVVALLSNNLRAELEQIETGLGMAAGSLSSIPSRPGDTGLMPRFLHPYEWPELDINQFPAILVLADGIASSTLSERQAVIGEPDAEFFRRVHPLRLFCYVLDQDFEKTSRARDRFELAIWRTLWRNRMLSDNAAIDKQSYASLYSDVEPVTGAKAMVSGFQARVSVICYESLDTPVEGSADTIEAEVDHLSWATG